MKTMWKNKACNFALFNANAGPNRWPHALMHFTQNVCRAPGFDVETRKLFWGGLHVR